MLCMLRAAMALVACDILENIVFHTVPLLKAALLGNSRPCVLLQYVKLVYWQFYSSQPADHMKVFSEGSYDTL